MIIAPQKGPDFASKLSYDPGQVIYLTFWASISLFVNWTSWNKWLKVLSTFGSLDPTSFFVFLKGKEEGGFGRPWEDQKLPGADIEKIFKSNQSNYKLVTISEISCNFSSGSEHTLHFF